MLGSKFFRTYAYDKDSSITLTFGAVACLRDGAERFYPMNFPRNERSSSFGNQGEGFATLDEAFTCRDLEELHLVSERVEEDAPAPSSLPQTVKRADLFGNVTDTYATEGELNGWREQQSALIGRQGGLL